MKHVVFVNILFCINNKLYKLTAICKPFDKRYCLFELAFSCLFGEDSATTTPNLLFNTFIEEFSLQNYKYTEITNENKKKNSDKQTQFSLSIKYM